MGERSRRIASQIVGMPGVNLRVIYSNATGEPEHGPGQWEQVPNACFFGAKFAAALTSCRSDVLLIVQADALFADWRQIVARCQTRFAERPRLGLWTPRIDHTPWTSDRVDVESIPDQGLTAVAQTDGVVLAFSSSVMRRMRELDYDRNNLGWGIDWNAICHCYTHGLEVLREDGQTVMHAPSRGYGWREAVSQWHDFMGQLNDQERRMLQILLRFTAEPRRGVFGKVLSAFKRHRAKLRVSALQSLLNEGAQRSEGARQ